jgi:hypothetical protein
MEHHVIKQRAGESVLHGPKKKKRRGFLVCPRLGLSVWFSGHSARAGQTLAKKAIKEKISAGGKSSH